jgi:SSS family solute:Na+ symporter
LRGSSLDTGVFLAYFLIIVLIGFLAGSRKKDSARDFFVTSSRLPWYIVGFAMLASSISTEQFIGSAGFTYKWGLAVFNWELGNWPAMLILLWIFLPVYFGRRIMTMPGYLEQRFGEGPRNLYAVITILAAVFIILPGVIYTGGFLLEEIFGIPKYAGFWLMAVTAGTFTIYGGMISVAWVQLFQAVLLLCSGMLVFFLAITQIDGGFSAIVWPAGEAARQHLILPMDHPELPWTSILVLALPVNIWYFCTSQPIIQACLGARSERDGKAGIILLGFLMLVTALSVEFPGLIAYALNPSLDSPDSAYPYVVKELISPGLRGLVLAGLCGAVMSTIEALIHSSSAVFTLDIYSRFWKKSSESSRIKVGRWTSGIVLLSGVLWAPVVGSFPTIFEFFQKCWFFIAAPVAAVFLLAVLWKRANRPAAFWTLSLSFPMLVVPHLILAVEKEWSWQINEFNLAGLIFLFSVLLMVTISSLTQPPAESQVKGLVWNPGILRGSTDFSVPWYKNLTLWCFIWVSVMVAIYIRFW